MITLIIVVATTVGTAATGHYTFALDKGVARATPLAIVLDVKDGVCAGQAYAAAISADQQELDASALTATDTEITGLLKATVKLKDGLASYQYQLKATITDGRVSGTYTEGKDADQVTGAIIPWQRPATPRPLGLLPFG
ncbi:MAG: hypothetical protein WCJ56_05800 [bacterium]